MKKYFFLFIAIMMAYDLAYAQTLVVPGGNGNIGNSNNANVGIGISDPLDRLHIDEGSIRISKVRLGNNSVYPMLTATQHVNKIWGFAGIYHLEDGSGGFGQGGGLVFKTSTNDTAPESRMTIRANGNVGIGTTDPQSKLEVIGNINLYSGSPLGAMTIGSVTGNLYELAGAQRGTDGTNQGQGGFGLVSGDGQISPVVWMFDSPNNAFQVRRKVYNSTVQSGPILFQVTGYGSVGIGIDSPDPAAKLTVNGKVLAQEIKVKSDVTSWADFVFNGDYNLPTLNEVETYISENHHLPDIPSEAEVMENGILLGEMNAKLLQKIEELTLYTIDQEKEIKAQNEKLIDQNQRIEKLEALLLEITSTTGNIK